jgi:hypothetical protein
MVLSVEEGEVVVVKLFNKSRSYFVDDIVIKIIYIYI